MPSMIFYTCLWFFPTRKNFFTSGDDYLKSHSHISLLTPLVSYQKLTKSASRISFLWILAPFLVRTPTSQRTIQPNDQTCALLSSVPQAAAVWILQPQLLTCKWKWWILILVLHSLVIFSVWIRLSAVFFVDTSKFNSNVISSKIALLLSQVEVNQLPSAFSSSPL